VPVQAARVAMNRRRPGRLLQVLRIGTDLRSVRPGLPDRHDSHYRRWLSDRRTVVKRLKRVLADAVGLTEPINSRMVGKPYLGITSRLPVILPQSRQVPNGVPSSRKPTFVVCDSASVRFTSEPAVSIGSDAVFPCSARSSEIFYRPHVSGTASFIYGQRPPVR
jgi:hypothetical protein